MRTSSAELLIELDRSHPRGLRAQIEDELRTAIRSGRLSAGTPLPSTRSLAVDLGVTRGVVVAAYDQLLAEGYLASRAGSGTTVNATAARDAPPRRLVEGGGPLVVDFRPGRPDVNLFPRAAWLRATRAALRVMPGEDLGYIDPRGLASLRDALADYLGRVRGVAADGDHVVICNGFSHGLSLAVRALREVGRDVVAVENPGYDDACHELDALGVRRRSVDVDEQGIVVDQLRRARCRAVVVTPAHQSPTGVVLSAARRSGLVAWARETDGYIIEDDYDAEFRYDRHPVGALQGVAPDRVIYSGTTSKILSPGLRLGWLVVPPQLVESIVAGRRVIDHATSSFLQGTYAAFLTTGDLDRHLRRTRRVYRQRRDALIAALARWLPGATPSGVAAGLQLVLTLPRGLDEATVAARARAAGIGVYPLGNYYTADRGDRPPALVLGYGPVTPAQSELGVRLLADAVGE